LDVQFLRGKNGKKRGGSPKENAISA